MIHVLIRYVLHVYTYTLELFLSTCQTVGISRANFISLSVRKLEQATQLLHALSRHLDVSPLLKPLKITS